jgi:hypothetical protein
VRMGDADDGGEEVGNAGKGDGDDWRGGYGFDPEGNQTGENLALVCSALP